MEFKKTQQQIFEEKWIKMQEEIEADMAQTPDLEAPNAVAPSTVTDDGTPPDTMYAENDTRMFTWYDVTDPNKYVIVTAKNKEEALKLIGEKSPNLEKAIKAAPEVKPEKVEPGDSTFYGGEIVNSMIWISQSLQSAEGFQDTPEPTVEPVEETDEMDVEGEVTDTDLEV
jgi:hypothetical protein